MGSEGTGVNDESQLWLGTWGPVAHFLGRVDDRVTQMLEETGSFGHIKFEMFFHTVSIFPSTKFSLVNYFIFYFTN